MNNIVLYELAGADANLRFSPYCWRTRISAPKRWTKTTAPMRAVPSPSSKPP